MAFDISDLKEHNSELLKLLTLNLPDMLWVKDLNGIYLYANQAICDGLLMAKDTQEPIGKSDIFFALREREAHKNKPHWHTFGELCFDSDQVVIDNNKPMRFEEFGNVKGELFYLEVYKAPFYNSKGDIIGTVGAGRDITEFKKAQLDLEEKNKILAEQQRQIESFNVELEKKVYDEIKKREKQESIMIHQSRQAAMGEILESIAHQWRQPLNIIGIATANLETEHAMGISNNENFENKMKIISENINYMSHTIDDFRKFLSPSRETFSFHLKECIEQTLVVFEAQMKEHNIACTLTTSCNFPVEGLENEFKQVMFILLNNAIDAIKSKMDEGELTRGLIDIRLHCYENKIVVNVKDNGGGINITIIDSIFDAYFSTKFNANGTGIGLYIAKNIIEGRMQGQIKVANQYDGCTFSMELPYINEE